MPHRRLSAALKVSTQRSSSGENKTAPYICALCRRGFTRRATVKDPHFASCVRKHGNPNNVAWDDHPSCYTILEDGTKGPSGKIPTGLSGAAGMKKEVGRYNESMIQLTPADKVIERDR